MTDTHLLGFPYHSQTGPWMSMSYLMLEYLEYLPIALIVSHGLLNTYLLYARQTFLLMAPATAPQIYVMDELAGKGRHAHAQSHYSS